MIITFFKLNKIWIRLTKYSLWVKLKCSHYKTFFEMLRYLPLLAWKWPMKCSMKCKVSWYFVSLWESLWVMARSRRLSVKFVACAENWAGTWLDCYIFKLSQNVLHAVKCGRYSKTKWFLKWAGNSAPSSCYCRILQFIKPF